MMLAYVWAEVQWCASANSCNAKDTNVAGQCPNDVDRSVAGPAMALLQSQRLTQRGHAVANEDSELQENLGRGEHAVGKGSEVDLASGPPCTCEANNPNWTRPAPRAPVCWFIDLGAADGNTFRSFAADGYGPVQNCPSGGQYQALLVEANPRFAERLTQVQANHPENVRVMSSTAAYMCEGNTSFFLDTTTTDHNYWGSSLSKDHWDVQRSGRQKVTVPLVNVARLLVENALPEDYVLLKMDIEGAEWDIVPCLSQSPEAAKLIDALYMEKHPSKLSLVGTDQATFDRSIEGLTQQGVNVPEYSSPTF